MPDSVQILNAKYLSLVPLVGNTVTIPVPEICQALGVATSSADQGLAIFSAWAASQGLVSFGLTPNLEILARRFQAPA